MAVKRPSLARRVADAVFPANLRGAVARLLSVNNNNVVTRSQSSRRLVELRQQYLQVGGFLVGWQDDAQFGIGGRVYSVDLGFFNFRFGKDSRANSQMA